LIISISAVVLLGALTALLVWYAGLRAWHAAVCILFGFYLATSPVGPWIGQTAASLARLATGH
jgi:hypothetical protein